MTGYRTYVALLAAVAVAAACGRDTRAELDTAGAALGSAAGAIAADVRGELAVLDVDIGRRADSERKVDEEMDTFARTDTIYASVQTTGTVRQGAISTRWTFPDGSVITQDAQPTAQERDATLLFFLTEASGLKPGQYTFAVVVDGREVRSEKVTVR